MQPELQADSLLAEMQTPDPSVQERGRSVTRDSNRWSRSNLTSEPAEAEGSPALRPLLLPAYVANINRDGVHELG